jgi:hypothetical protein
MSPVEQKQLEADMNAFQEEFNKLSPKEQDSFYQTLEETVQKIEDIAKTEEGKNLLEKLDRGELSDTEFDQLINRLVGEEKPEPEVEPVVEKIEEKPKRARKTEKSSPFK